MRRPSFRLALRGLTIALLLSTSGRRHRSRIRGWTAGLPLAVVVGVCCALPLGWLVWQAIANPKLLLGVGMPSRQSLLLLGRTLLYNGSAAVLATALALPAALVIGRGRGFIAALISLLLPMALVMPSICYTYGWLQVCRLLGIWLVPAGPADVIRCIWTLASWLWPLPAAAIGLSLRYGDSTIQQQALLDGALWRITFRQLVGPIIASLAIVALLAMQEFGVYERSGISVIATEVRTVFETGLLSGQGPTIIAGVISGSGLSTDTQPQRAAAAVATGLPMLGIVAALVFLAFRASSRLRVDESATPGDWPRALDAGWLAKSAGLLVLVLTLVVPVAAMAVSISPQRWQNDPQGHGPVMRVWLWAQPYVLGSLTYGLTTGAVALAVGVLACIRRSRFLLGLAIAVFLLGGELLAIANIRIYNRPAPWPLGAVRLSGHDLFGLIYNNVPVMVIAYLGRFGWLALLAGQTTWSPAYRQLRDVAAVDGAGPWRTMLSVVWPIAWPALASAGMLVMILSMTEVSTSVLLSPQRPQTLIVTLMGWVHMLRYDDMLEGSLLLMAVVFVLAAGAVALGWAGLRLRKVLRSGSAIILIALLFCMPGCDDGRKPLAIWCTTGPAPGQLLYPRGIAYSPKDDCFFVVDRSARIQRIERDGACTAEWRMPNSDNGKPVGITVGPDGNVYVPDTHYWRVMVYSPKGQYLRQWGSRGRGPGQFVFPTDIAFDKQGNIYVSEYGCDDDNHSGISNDRIQVFDRTAARVIRTIGRYGQGDGEFSRPQSMLIDGDLLYVTDSCNHRIAVFKTDGTFVRNMGGVGTGLGQFRFPYGLDRDSEGHLVIAEFGNNRIQIVDKDTGKGLRTWGAAGREPGQLAYPWAVAVDKSDRIVAVDSGNDRLQVFR